ncbi:conserved Plasmodium protein, unknown function [Plasmodium vinckei vinckei]|uniref:Fam-c protein n=1 Tax=Plasmodium vinckei vinckei TaxID=54757 RepID=A0A449BYR6_PLAVN|nr:conserved Plasmodium protein, unknown function [Plasmodium vinckei vinckei]KEG04934.1 hypothetical protein YYE_00509 [Plasmodium vinckei vinckei]VEV58583.1 conserved Plasmodium protein, unknown function [Plasmodium vinckei vinckei]
MKRGSIYFLLSIFFIFNCVKSSDVPLNELSDSGNFENDQETSFGATIVDQPVEEEAFDIFEDHAEMFSIVRENNEELENAEAGEVRDENRHVNDYNNIHSNIEKYRNFDNIDAENLQESLNDMMAAEGMDALLNLYFKHKEGKVEDKQLIEELKKLQSNKEALKAIKTFITENYNVIKRHNLLEEAQSLKNFESLAEASLRFINNMIDGDLDEDTE